MAQIKQLDPHVADLIAAGEVVERPASVVKELMENAVDAGCTQLTVEIQNGGMLLIRVTDNGGGIQPEDAETAFLRHATSKLETARDLEAIGTLGFRGEALAAIAAVSRIEMMSRVPEAPLGVSLVLEGGVLRNREETGCPVGTTMMVRDLFFNTPARLKFMKRDVAEGAAVFSVVQRMALSHPEVSIKFLRDGKQDMLTPGDSKLSSAMYSVFGRDIAVGFTEVKGSGDDVSVTGFVSMPACCRGTRGYQHFILNGRPIRSRLLTAALEEAYQNQKMVGKFPGCVLHIETKRSAVDVNVHPAKTEVKFLSDKKIFDGVYYSVLSALGVERRHPVFNLESNQRKVQESQASQAPSILRDSMVGQGATTLLPPKPLSEAPVEPKKEPEAIPAWKPREIPRAEAEPMEQASIALMEAPTAAPGERPPVTEEKTAAEPEVAPETPTEAPLIALDEWRLAGEVLSTYIVVEQGETIYLIDKHAAHERMNFDRMKAGDYEPMSQLLLEPIVLNFTPEEGTMLLRHLPLLEEFGFQVEEFGGSALVVRQIPFDIAPGEVEGTLGELAEKLLTGKRTDPADARDDLLHTMACKAAIKGGQKNGPEELMRVTQAVMSGQVKYCPHGRPVAITLTRSQLERQFGRA